MESRLSARSGWPCCDGWSRTSGPGRRYNEAEVNEIISRRHPDFATLRRHLVDEELMQRQRSIYWRTGSVPNTGHDPSNWPLG